MPTNSFYSYYIVFSKSSIVSLGIGLYQRIIQSFLEEKNDEAFCHILCISEEISTWPYVISWSECCYTTQNNGKPQNDSCPCDGFVVLSPCLEILSVSCFSLGWKIFLHLKRNWPKFSPGILIPAVAGCNSFSLQQLDCFIPHTLNWQYFYWRQGIVN